MRTRLEQEYHRATVEVAAATARIADMAGELTYHLHEARKAETALEPLLMERRALLVTADELEAEVFMEGKTCRT